jgi:hypothetical protein
MQRLLLTLGTLGLAVGVYASMLKGWRNRQRRQADLPAPPTALGDAPVVLGPVSGLFVGTTGADHWLDRVAVHHLSDRSAAQLTVAGDGVHLERTALPELFVPWGSIESVDVETALGGKVVSTGMLLVTWALGERRLRSAFRADDRADHPRLLDAITARLTVEAS